MKNTLKNGLFSGPVNGLSKTVLCGLLSFALAESIQANLVVNGGFTTTTAGAFADTTAGAGQIGYNINVAGWTTTGSAVTGPYSYNFVFTSGSADTTGAAGEYGTLTLYGPGNGVANTLPATSPNGGNFVGLDSDVQYDAALSQTITGLVPGQGYSVSFFWAGAQQTSFNGPTTDTLAVSLGGQTSTTSSISVTNHGYSPWTQVTFNYTATSASEVLSFLATGTPLSPNEPPFVLLDGIDVEANTPDAVSSAVLFTLSLAALSIAAWRRKSALAAVSPPSSASA
jgi:hypothetical protein